MSTFPISNLKPCDSLVEKKRGLDGQSVLKPPHMILYTIQDHVLDENVYGK